MDGDLDGKASQDAAGEGDTGEQVLAQGHEDAPADGAQEVTGRADGGATDYHAALGAKDAQIAELQGKVASTAKTAETTEALNAEIAALKQQMADKPVEFALRAAGARSVKAAKALLGEHNGDVAALVAARPWLFEGAEPTSQRTSQTSTGGATGLEPAGVADGNDAAYMRHWERIAGLSDEGKEGQDMPNSIVATKKLHDHPRPCVPARGNKLVPELAGAHGKDGPQREGDCYSEDLRLGPGRLQAQRGTSCQCGLPAKMNYSLTAA